MRRLFAAFLDFWIGSEARFARFRKSLSTAALIYAIFSTAYMLLFVRFGVSWVVERPGLIGELARAIDNFLTQIVAVWALLGAFVAIPLDWLNIPVPALLKPFVVVITLLAPRMVIFLFDTLLVFAETLALVATRNRLEASRLADLARLSVKQDERDGAVAAAVVAGAAVGAVFGPLGMAVGAVLGGMIGAGVAEEADATPSPETRAAAGKVSASERRWAAREQRRARSREVLGKTAIGAACLAVAIVVDLYFGAQARENSCYSVRQPNQSCRCLKNETLKGYSVPPAHDEPLPPARHSKCVVL